MGAATALLVLLVVMLTACPAASLAGQQAVSSLEAAAALLKQGMVMNAEVMMVVARLEALQMSGRHPHLAPLQQAQACYHALMPCAC
jgi:hypothetical protein